MPHNVLTAVIAEAAVEQLGLTNGYEQSGLLRGLTNDEHAQLLSVVRFMMHNAARESPLVGPSSSCPNIGAHLPNDIMHRLRLVRSFGCRRT